MGQPEIETLQDLHAYLYAAMQLEHATIPPYLTAMYSIMPGTNSAAVHVLRVVAVEEMLHLTLAANVLNAVGGEPDLTAPDFVPQYPAYLPDGERDFRVDRQRFSLACVQGMLDIERPHEAPSAEQAVIRRENTTGSHLGVSPTAPEFRFFSIGEFYRAIDRGLRHLHKTMGDSLFSGDPARQVTSEYYFSGGGEVVPVTDITSACRALDLIAGQGEGFGASIYDREHELAHYYRFEQLTLGRFYQAGDKPGAPTGPSLTVDWDASYPIKTNATLADLPDGSEVRAAAGAFNRAYAEFLALLTRAYTGQPSLLIEAIGEMFRLRDLMLRLIRNPIPGVPHTNAAPTFEMASVVAVGAS